MKPIRDPLDYFLGGYLNQDFDLEYEDADQAASAYGSNERTETVVTTLGQIAVILASKPTGQELEAAFDAAGCAYVPDPDPGTWLARMGHLMAEAYANRGDVDSY